MQSGLYEGVLVHFALDKVDGVIWGKLGEDNRQPASKAVAASWEKNMDQIRP